MVNIGITLGDPSGIGPEIVAKSLASMNDDKNHFILFGDRDNFEDILKICGINSKIKSDFEFVNVGNGQRIETGKVNAYSGEIAVKSIEEAVKYALKNKVDAIATAPINKEAIKLAGSKYIDHTSMLMDLTGSNFVSTLFEVKNLRITFLSKHMSLMEAVKYVKKDNVKRAIIETYYSMRLLGFNNPKIAVAALNPHAGESGMFGSEEINEIRPAIEEFMGKINVYGPVPADSVFHYASLGNYDAVLSLYHDQGHIAAKTYDFDHTVSMNPGLPFLRTSVDHGTAFDIAGKNMASYISMREAIIKAEKYGILYKGNYMSLKQEISEVIK